MEIKAGKAAELARLDKIVEISSAKNRNFILVYLGLLIYIQAIVFSTTDLQLLVSFSLTLPIIGLSVPLAGFYVATPVFILMLHRIFLLNLESHHYKLMRWRDAHPNGHVPRSRIPPFLFDYAMLGEQSPLWRSARNANSLLCFDLAPITLGLLLWRYTDRQDCTVTVWQYLVFVLDSYLVWTVRQALQENAISRPAGEGQYPVATVLNRSLSQRARAWAIAAAKAIFEPLLFIRDIPRYGLHGVFGLALLLETLLTLLITGVSSEHFISPHGSQYNLAYSLDTQDSLPKVDWVLPRIRIDPAEQIWQPDANALEAAAKLAGYGDWVKYFNKNGEGFRPAITSLRLASLPNQNLPNALFHGIELQGAYMANTRLQGADFVDAKMQGIHLAGAELQGTLLYSAQMQGSDLIHAQLQGADLTYAQLQGALLMRTQLQGADLDNAQLQGVDLDYAQLQGARLRRTNLQGTNLNFTGLQAADLSGSQLQGAILFHTGVLGIGVDVHTDTPVYGIEPMFDHNAPNWEDLKSIANWEELESMANIPRFPFSYLYRPQIQYAKSLSVPNADPQWKHNPADIAQQALPLVCKGEKDTSHLARLSAVRGFRAQLPEFAKKLIYRPLHTHSRVSGPVAGHRPHPLHPANVRRFARRHCGFGLQVLPPANAEKPLM